MKTAIILFAILFSASALFCDSSLGNMYGNNWSTTVCSYSYSNSACTLTLNIANPANPMGISASNNGYTYTSVSVNY